MQSVGFKNLLGIDPYLKKEIVGNKNLKILKKNLSEISNTSFDCVMFHHVFEHLGNPHQIFKTLQKVVKKNGNVIIRIPVIDSYAWEVYKTNWVQLDPPRHFYLHTVKSINFLANKYNFEINKIIYDSTSFQFWGSEQYNQQIPLVSPKSYFISHNKSIFSKSEIKIFECRAMELNQIQRGDTACFFLKNMN